MVRPLPLAGVRVIELANFVSGPFATMMLADLGADVIKVESPRGDPLRRFGRSGHPVSPLFVNTNRGKRSITLDLKLERDQAAARSLLATADVMVCNWRPAVVQRLGLDDDVLAAANPRLVRMYVSGFGADGPLADIPTFDAVVQARVGMADSQGGKERPSLVACYLVDKLSAAMVAQAALAALLARERSGHAERVDVTLLDAAAYLDFPDIMARRTFLTNEPALARNEQAAAARAIRASDGWLVVVPVTAEQIRRSLHAIGRPELIDELLRTSDATALTHRMLDELERATRTGTVEQWVTTFTAADVPAAPCLDLDQHLADEQVRHNELYEVSEWEGLGPVRHVRYPASFSTWGKLRARSRPPQPGEHTAAIFEEIGAGDRG